VIEALRRVIKRMHYPLEVMLVCVRWYAAYPLSFRHIEEMMGERGVLVSAKVARVGAVQRRRGHRHRRRPDGPQEPGHDRKALRAQERDTCW